MGRPFKQYLNGNRIYTCATCRAHAADCDDVISKVSQRTSQGAQLSSSVYLAQLTNVRALQAFSGKHGRAFLVHNV